MSLQTGMAECLREEDILVIANMSLAADAKSATEK